MLSTLALLSTSVSNSPISSRPLIRGGNDTSRFPIVVVCRNRQEADQTARLNLVVPRLETLPEDELHTQLDRLATVLSFKNLLTTDGSYYAVRLGKDGMAGIWLEW